MSWYRKVLLLLNQNAYVKKSSCIFPMPYKDFAFCRLFPSDAMSALPWTVNEILSRVRKVCAQMPTGRHTRTLLQSTLCESVSLCVACSTHRSCMKHRGTRTVCIFGKGMNLASFCLWLFTIYLFMHHLIRSSTRFVLLAVIICFYSTVFTYNRVSDLFFISKLTCFLSYYKNETSKEFTLLCMTILIHFKPFQWNI